MSFSMENLSCHISDIVFNIWTSLSGMHNFKDKVNREFKYIQEFVNNVAELQYILI